MCCAPGTPHRQNIQSTAKTQLAQRETLASGPCVWEAAAGEENGVAFGEPTFA